MPVRADIVGYARGLFDRPSYHFNVKPGMTVRDLLKELSGHASPDFSHAIYDVRSDRLNEHIVIFVNSREIRALEGPDTKLKDGDVITILPPMAGG
jgi:molybdopterin synthase sulfur carrier subunit